MQNSKQTEPGPLLSKEQKKTGKRKSLRMRRFVGEPLLGDTPLTERRASALGRLTRPSSWLKPSSHVGRGPPATHYEASYRPCLKKQLYVDLKRIWGCSASTSHILNSDITISA